MNNATEFTLRDYFEVIARERRLFILVFSLVALATLLLAMLLPSVYRSQAIILIEQQEIPSDLVRSTVTSFASQRIQVISQRVMTTTNLKEILEKHQLYGRMREREPLEVVLEKMRDDIDRRMISADVVDPRSGRPTEATIAFSLSYQSRVPQLAQKVVGELVSLYLKENIKRRTEAAADTSSFLTDEAKFLRDEVADLERQLAEFKSENVHNRPELERVLRDSLSRAEFELNEVDSKMDAAEQMRVYVEAELAEHEAAKKIDSPAEIRAKERLEEAESQLAAAEAAYGDSHPDVKRLRRQAEAIRAEADPDAAREIYSRQLARAQTEFRAIADAYDEQHPDFRTARRTVGQLEAKLNALPAKQEERPNNPAYIVLQSREEGTRVELESLRSRKLKLMNKVDEITENLYRIPEVEARYRSITREYDATVAKYQEITSKQMEARLSESLESERKAERFTLIEPPLLPEQPDKPNRPVILVFGLVLSFIAAFGSVALAAAFDTKVRGRRGVQNLVTMPPLASIPYVFVSGEPTRRSNWRKIAVAAIAVPLLLMAIHLLYRPLDVMWFVVLRKFGF